MSHDSEAAYATSEVADILLHRQADFFGNMGTANAWSLFAGRESGHTWPLADGAILAKNPTNNDVNIAFEYKRPNEGVHGILTALGQSFAYLHKGYDASVMVIPKKYSSHLTPGQHVRDILETTAPRAPIIIYTYEEPDMSATRPFKDKLVCQREISLPNCTIAERHNVTQTRSLVSTLWAHMREGMSHPDAFFRYCQAVKIVSSIGESLADVDLPTELINAVYSLGGTDPFKYLSNTAGDTVSDKAWRYVWFHYYFWNDLIPLYSSASPYLPNETSTKIRINADDNQRLFSGRVDSIKNKLCRELNKEVNPLSIEEAWIKYVKKVRSDAHSYREVIDSGLYHIGFLTGDGTLSDLGYKFVDTCERTNISYDGVPMDIIRAAVLQNGQYGALLHYVYKLSEEKFRDDLFAFSSQRGNSYDFDKAAYMSWLDDIFANQLHISKKTTMRTEEGTRQPLQAELAVLKKMGFVKVDDRDRIIFRVGVGLDIDWPQVQSSMLYFQNI